MNKKEKNKKKLLLLLGVSVLTVIGSTLAYFTTSSEFVNTFKTAMYGAEIKETFESPSNWTPGTTTDKTVIVTNNGDIPIAARASYIEEWESANGATLPLKQGENAVAIINFKDGWTLADDGYYYYGSKENMTSINKGESSTSFISGVTFNDKITSELVSNISSDGKTITYTSSGDGYDNATYKLIIKIDTIQYDEASAWN